MTLSNRATAWLLVALCLALYLPGLTALPPFDQDEALFAQSAKQMLESGDFVQIRFQDQARSKKPALSYWLQAGAAALTGARDSIWPYRLPSLLGVTLATLLTFWCGIRLFGAGAGALGAVLFAASLMAVIQAHMARADGALVAAVVAAQGALAALYLAARSGQPAPRYSWLVFWIAQGLAVLVKGPILAMTSLLTIGALAAMDADRLWLRSIRWLPGLMLATLIAAPWFVAASLTSNDGFVGPAISSDLLPKLLSVQDGHGGPPGYYLATGFVMFWPASLLVGLAGVLAWRHRAQPAVRFCAAWIVPTWLVFELIPTKLPHYTLPVYPALALLAGAAVVEAVTDRPRMQGGWRAFWPVPIAAAVAIGCAAFAIGLPLAIDGSVGAWSFVAAAAALATLASGWLSWRDDWRRAIAWSVAGAGMWSVVMLQFVLPSIDGMWFTRSVAIAAAAAGFAVPNADPPIAVAGTDAGSLVFLLGTGTVIGNGVVAADHVVDHPGALAIVGRTAGPAFAARLTIRGASVRAVGHVDGFDYVYGVRRSFDLYIADPAVR